MTTDTHAKTDLEPESLQLGGAAARMSGLGLVLAVVGIGAACAFAFLDAENRRVFFHAYLVAFAFYLSITLGGLFVVLLHHLSRAGWSVTLRRLAEGISGNIWLMALLCVPLLLGLDNLYEWAHAHAAEHDKVLAAKAAYLNPAAFIARCAAYFCVWGFLAWYLRSRSIRQDQSGDVALSRAMEKVSAPGMVAFAFTATFAAFDLLMSLNPHWFSTVFGVYFFSGSIMSFLAVLALLALWLQAKGRIRAAITTEHYHDLGKLTFAFVCFWGYIALSQYLLIWYANLPEETQFYQVRQIGPWAVVSGVLLVCHLAIPFLGLMSRHIKRRVGIFAFWAVWLLAAHLLDLYWLVMPNLYAGDIPDLVGAAQGTPLPQVMGQLVASNQSIYELAGTHATFMHSIWEPLQARCLLVTLGLVVGMGGLYLASTIWLLRGAALVPVKDPRLSESLAFENA